MLALWLLVLLLYQEFGFSALLGNCLFSVLGSILWQPGQVDSLSSLLPCCSMGMDYHEGIFGVHVDVNFLSLGQH